MKKYIPIEKDSLQLSREKEFVHSKSQRLKDFYHDKEKYYSIDKNLLLPDVDIIFSLFIQKSLEFEPLLLALENLPVGLTPEILGYEGNILIKSSDIPLYEKYIKSLNGQNNNPNITSDNKNASLMKEKSKIIVKDMLEDPTNTQNIKKCGEVIEEMVYSILNKKELFYNLISIKSHDFYTYIHSVNVAVLSIGLGIAAHLSNEDIYNIGIGALLHDIGKCTVPPEILNKIGKLTSTEYKIMKNHVIEGEKILKKHPNFPEAALTAITQHHERLSGKGYPLNLTGANISVFGKITAVTDCYDSLTTPRLDKPALTPFEALSILVHECEHYDSDLLKTFIKLIGGIQQ